MKKVVKISLIIGILWVSGVGWYYGYEHFQEQKTAQENQNQSDFQQNLSHEVVRQDIISSLNFSGNTKIKNQQKLKFPADTKIVWVYKNPWDTVKSGEILAEIDKKNVLTQIEIAKINFVNAELKLKKVQENTADIEIKKAQLEYEKAQKDLENKKSNLIFFEKDLYAKLESEKKSLDQKKLSLVIIQKEVEKNIKEIKKSPNNQNQSLEQSQNKLANLEREYQRETINFDLNLKKKQNENTQILEKEYLSIQNSLNALNKNFQELDKLFRLKSESSANDDFMIYFSAKNTNYKNKAGNYFAWAYAKFIAIEKKFNALGWKYTSQDVINLANEQIALYEDLYIASDNMMRGLDNSVVAENFDEGKISSYYGIASSIFSDASSKKVSLKNVETDLKNMKTNDEIKEDLTQELENKRLEIANMKLTIEKSKDDLDLTNLTLDQKIEQENDKITDKKREISDATLALEKSQKNIAYELDAKKKEIMSDEISLTQIRKRLQDMLDITTNQELVSAENDFKQAKVTLENEQAKLKDYELSAPFDGVLTKVDYKVWDNIGTNDEKHILIENPDILEVSIFADQVDITKLKKWQKALISYDAFPWVQFDGEIIEIDATPQDKDGVTKYEVKIFVKKQEQKIFSGMMANVNIVTEEKKQVLSIPFMALKTDDTTGETYVSVLGTDGKKEKRKVVAWYNDGVNTEILEWLKEWEKVLEIDYDANTFQPQDFETMGGGF